MLIKKKLKTFNEKELRCDFYPMFLNLMDKGCQIEAYMFILSTWNFARFRYAMKKFNLGSFHDKIKQLEPLFKKMQHEDFAAIDFDRYAIEIKTIFKTLARIKGIEITGAPKLMHLKLPKVFVMWDSYIRKALGYKKGSAYDYICFLKEMQKKFCNCNAPSNKTLAKAIDEYNFDKYSAPALRDKKHKVINSL